MVWRTKELGWAALVACAICFAGCGDKDENPGGVSIIETGYLSCEDGGSACTGQALCKDSSGKDHCVDLPSACDGVLSCACLGDVVCKDAECKDDANGGLVCEAPVDPDACTPGGSFASADGCNTCGCPDSGKKSEAACTTKACVEPECVAGEMFPADDGCNTCTCPDSGLKSEAACTEMACVWLPCDNKKCGTSCEPCDPADPNCPQADQAYACDSKGDCLPDDEAIGTCEDPDQCEPGESIPSADGCNTCACPASGKKSEAVQCTEMACPPYDPCENAACGEECDPCDPNDPECVSLDVEMACNPGGVCIALTPDLCNDEDACIEGETFPAGDGCNSCTCQASGKKSEAICTLIACAPTCHNHADCDGAICYWPGEPIGCGACFTAENTCLTDTDCTSGDPAAPLVCKQSNIDDCLCESAMICKPGCTSDNQCGTAEFCDVDNHCKPQSCIPAVPCPANYGCGGGGVCEQLACQDDSECQGYCVKSKCYNDLGTCGFPPP